MTAAPCTMAAVPVGCRGPCVPNGSVGTASADAVGDDPEGKQLQQGGALPPYGAGSHSKANLADRLWNLKSAGRPWKPKAGAAKRRNMSWQPSSLLIWSQMKVTTAVMPSKHRQAAAGHAAASQRPNVGSVTSPPTEGAAATAGPETEEILPPAALSKTGQQQERVADR